MRKADREERESMAVSARKERQRVLAAGPFTLALQYRVTCWSTRGDARWGRAPAKMSVVGQATDGCVCSLG